MNWPYEWQVGWRYTRAGRVATDTVQSAVLPGSPTAVPVYALKAA